VLTWFVLLAGRLILALETTRHIMVSPATRRNSPAQDEFGREPFQHPALANVDKLQARQPRDIVSKEKLAKLALDVGMLEVVRWKPKMVCQLAAPACLTCW
jgi:large subunit ribosomal protein L15